jgi:hypothetical protein
VLSVILTGAKAFPHGLEQVVVLVTVTTVIYWLAHVYAHGLAYGIGQEAHLSLAELGRIARREASILEAGLPPATALVLGAVGLLSEEVAVWLAFGLGLAVLGTTGVVFARVEGPRHIRTRISTASCSVRRSNSLFRPPPFCAVLGRSLPRRASGCSIPPSTRRAWGPGSFS